MDPEVRARYKAVMKIAIASIVFLILPAQIFFRDISLYIHSRSLFGTGWVMGTFFFWGFCALFFAALVYSLFSHKFFSLLSQLSPLFFLGPVALFVTFNLAYSFFLTPIVCFFPVFYHSYQRHTTPPMKDVDNQPVK